MNKGYIYKITSPSDKVYIGQTVNLNKRFNKYNNLHCKGQVKLYNSFKKYGVNNHIFVVICEVSQSELNDIERYYQDYYNSVEKGLNCRLTKSNDKSGSLSLETRNKLSKAAIGKKMSKEARVKMSESKLGKNKGFDNHKSIKILCRNVNTLETFKMNLSSAANYFNVDRELISNRINGVTKNPRKLKDWRFTLINDRN